MHRSFNIVFAVSPVNPNVSYVLSLAHDAILKMVHS